MKLTKVVFFKNTPLTDYNNTIHFNSDIERDDFFLKGNHYDTIKFVLRGVNFIKDRQTFSLSIKYENFAGYNYLTFLSDFDNRRYYAFVNAYEYVNDSVTKVYFVIDTIMTFTQGTMLNGLKNVNIERQHLTYSNYLKFLPQLRNNDDVIKTYTKFYKDNRYFDFGENYVMFQSSVNLSARFGDKEDPNITSSHGLTYDNIAGATDVYVVKYSEWNTIFFPQLTLYPWISQNFSKIQLIPSKFINEDDLVKVNSSENLKSLYILKHNGKSKSVDLSPLNYSFNELQKIMSVNDDKYQHLIRNEYLTIELYNYNGGQLFLDGGKISREKGLKLKSKNIIGYDNDIKIYPENYASGLNENTPHGTEHGSFLASSLSINTFVQLPIMLNTGDLAKANQANKQAFAESQLTTNKAKDLFSKDASVKDRLYDSISLASDLRPANILGKSSNEYLFYQKQQADYKDLALKPPTITESSMGNAFLIANELNGITLKISVPDNNELNKIKKYYNTYGFEMNIDNARINDINSMTIMNYLKISGNYLIGGIPVNLYNQLNATLENGVKFWHNNNTGNPMEQDLINNDFRTKFKEKG